MSTSQKKKQMTLLQAMERVVELSKDSQMSQEFMKKAKAEIQLLAKSYEVTERQVVLFCVCMEKGPRRVDYDDLASHLDISKIKIMGYATDIDALVRRRLLKYRDVKDEEDFDVPNAVVRCLKHNEVYQLPQRTGLDCAAMFELLDQWFDDLNDDAIGSCQLRDEIQSLFDDNPQVAFVHHLRQYGLSAENEMIAAFFCNRLVNNNDDDIRFNQLSDLFENSRDYNNAKAELRSAQHTLMKKKLVEHICEDGIADTSKYHLTADAQRDLLAELNINPIEETLAGTLKLSDLTPKKMFYPQEVEKQVNELSKLFQQEEILYLYN